MNAVDETFPLGMARDAVADAFAETMMQWAKSSCLLVPG